MNPVDQPAVPPGIVTTTVAFVFDGEGSAARNCAWETPAALHVAVVQDWADVRGAAKAAASEIRIKSMNVFIVVQPVAENLLVRSDIYP